MLTLLSWLLRSWVCVCRILLRWLRPQAKPYWPSPRTGWTSLPASRPT